MKLRYLVWVAVVLAAVVAAALLVPGSPFSFQNTLGDPETEDLPLEEMDKPLDPTKKYKKRPLREWTADLGSPDKAVRQRALLAVDRIAPLSAKAVPTLAKMMADDPDPELRDKASHVLFRVGPAGSKQALDAVIAALGSDRPAVRRNAALTLLSLKADARPAAPALMAAVADPKNDTAVGHHETIQAVAAAALGPATAPSGEAVGVLTAALAADRPDQVKRAAARSLGMIGAAAKPAVPALTALLQSPSLDVRVDVTEALQLLGEKLPEVEMPKNPYPPGFQGNNSGFPAGGGDAGKDKKDDPPGKKD